MEETMTAGLFGLGCVGQGFYDILNQSPDVNISIATVCVKDRDKKRAYPELKYTFSKEDIFRLAPLNAIVELTDDPEKAYQIVKEALEKRIPVVTANKKMLAENFQELYRLQQENDTTLLYEASVGGSIPIIRNLEEYYDTDSLVRITGVLNGTCNYILTKMELEQLDYAAALADCQAKGFAETDPWLDVSGSDTKYKILLLTIHGFGVVLKPADILNLGIQNISFSDIAFARERGCRIKMVASAARIGDKLRVFALPHLVGPEHALYNVMHEFNAVDLEGAHACSQVITGKGAGKYPTGSAVLSDVSALTNNYRYSYKKLMKKSRSNFPIGNGAALLDNDFTIRLYIRFRDGEALKKLEIVSIEQEGGQDDGKYVIAQVRFRSLFNITGSDNTLFVAAL